MLKIQGLSKRYGSDKRGSTALNSVSLTLDEGQSLGIVGESGAGKSTLAKCILGVVPPSSGHVWFDRRKVDTMSSQEQKQFWQNAQIIWQDPGLSLSPHRRIWQIIAEPLENNTQLNRQEIRRRVDRLLSQVGLDPALGQDYRHQLSGGQCQRVCIARALAIRPRLLICDEPVSALDLPMQMRIMDLIDNLRQSLGIAVILITHDIGLARRYCNQVSIMHKGCIIETGPSDTILNHSTHPYTKRLINAIPQLPWR